MSGDKPHETKCKSKQLSEVEVGPDRSRSLADNFKEDGAAENLRGSWKSANLDGGQHEYVDEEGHGDVLEAQQSARQQQQHGNDEKHEDLSCQDVPLEGKLVLGVIGVRLLHHPSIKLSSAQQAPVRSQ